MSGPRTSVAGDLAREYCEKYPRASTNSLVRMLMRDHPKVFTGENQADCRVRYARGEQGKKNRSAGKPVPKVYKLPASDAKPVQPWVFDGKGFGSVISDLHVPYHDNRAIETTLRFIEREGATDFLIIDGDFLDCYQLSRFDKDPRQRCFASELEAGRAMLDVFLGIYKRVVFKEGNHEVRYQHYLQRKAAELLGIDEFELRNLLKLDDRGISYVKANQVIHAGPLNILHGHEYGGGFFAPVNPARGMFMRAKRHTLSGHNHQTSEHNETDIRRGLTSNWSMGCQCDLSPEYAALNKWNHGFATLGLDGQIFEVENKRIIDGRVL